MKKLLSIALCLIAVGGFAQKGKTKMAADFYGVDYSCVSVIGANEQPAEFIKAFEAINRLFLSEPKKYDVAGFTGIDILSTSVEQANEALGGLAAEQLYSTWRIFFTSPSNSKSRAKFCCCASPPTSKSSPRWR